MGNFKCKTSGECILDGKVCDGTVDCNDKTDETVELCGSRYCPSYGFRCVYGGCVDQSSKCGKVILISKYI